MPAPKIMIIWIASYPKSGNTYLRSFISSYYFSKKGKFDFDLLLNILQFPSIKFSKKKIYSELEASQSWIYNQQQFFSGEKIHFVKMLKPHTVIASHFNGKKINETTYESVMSFFFLYIITFAFSALLLSFSGLDFLTSISASASAISNVGPGLGDVIGPDGNYSSLSDYSKLILICTMFLGRLEMLTILVLFLPSFWKD